MAYIPECWHVTRRRVIWARWPRAGRAPGAGQCETMQRATVGGQPAAERAGRPPYEPESKHTHCQVALLLPQGGPLIAVWIISSFVVVKSCVDARHREETKLKLHLCVKKCLGVFLYPCFAMGLLFKAQYKSLCKNQNTFGLCNVPEVNVTHVQ